MNRRTALLVLPAIAVFWGCAAADKPAEPVWGRQACAHCAMLLSDRRFGAQLVDAQGERQFFDDPGCMVLFIEERGIQPTRAWVRDAATERWLDARAARYAASAPSPMDFGFEARAADGVEWDALRARVLQNEKARRER